MLGESQEKNTHINEHMTFSNHYIEKLFANPNLLVPNIKLNAHFSANHLYMQI